MYTHFLILCNLHYFDNCTILNALIHENWKLKEKGKGDEYVSYLFGSQEKI